MVVFSLKDLEENGIEGPFSELKELILREMKITGFDDEVNEELFARTIPGEKERKLINSQV